MDIRSEAVENYINGLAMILSQGWEVLGITVDGRKGIIPALKTYAPVQFCQFHQTAIVTRYLGKYPRLEANWELKRISLLLKDLSKKELKDLLANWYLKHNQFLKERTYHDNSRWSYTHRRTRSCFRSFIRNLDDLFTYRNHPCMPNTTNCVDGYISYLRNLHRSHNGTKLHRRRKITEEILRGKSTKKSN